MFVEKHVFWPRHVHTEFCLVYSSAWMSHRNEENAHIQLQHRFPYIYWVSLFFQGLCLPDGPFFQTSCSTVVKSMPCTQRCACAWGTGAQLCMCKGHWSPSVHVQWNTAQTLKPESPKPETLNWNAATHISGLCICHFFSRVTRGPKP